MCQALSPGLVSRGRDFGSALRPKAIKWACIDACYFEAPGQCDDFKRVLVSVCDYLRMTQLCCDVEIRLLLQHPG